MAVLLSLRQSGRGEGRHGVVPGDDGRALPPLRVSQGDEGAHVTGGVGLPELGEQLADQMVLRLVEGRIIFSFFCQFFLSFEV